jgi:hypothetical protein
LILLRRGSPLLYGCVGVLKNPHHTLMMDGRRTDRRASVPFEKEKWPPLRAAILLRFGVRAGHVSTRCSCLTPGGAPGWNGSG